MSTKWGGHQVNQVSGKSDVLGESGGSSEHDKPGESTQIDDSLEWGELEMNLSNIVNLVQLQWFVF